MYQAILSKDYKKAITRLFKSGKHKDVVKVEKVIDVLSSGYKLDSKFKDHKLNGEMSDLRECHIKTDLLLVYKKDKTKLVLLLIEIGNHNNLFK